VPLSFFFWVEELRHFFLRDSSGELSVFVFRFCFYVFRDNRLTHHPFDFDYF